MRRARTAAWRRIRRRATRRSSYTYELGRHVRDARAVAVPFHVRQHGREHLIRMPSARAHGGDGDLGQLPAIELANLRRGDVVLLSQSFEQSAHHLTLRLERSALDRESTR